MEQIEETETFAIEYVEIGQCEQFSRPSLSVSETNEEEFPFEEYNPARTMRVSGATYIVSPLETFEYQYPDSHHTQYVETALDDVVETHRPSLSKVESETIIEIPEEKEPSPAPPPPPEEEEEEGFTYVKEEIPDHKDLHVQKSLETAETKLYFVSHKQSGREYVLKTLKSKTSLLMLEQKKREIVHPSLVRRIGTLKKGNYYSSLLEFEEMYNLFSLVSTVERRAPYGSEILPLTFCKYVARRFLGVLGILKKAGVVHCNFRSQNLVILPDSRIKLCSFDPREDSTTLSKEWIERCESEYCSPEAIRGQPVTWRSDLWSFGCFLYKLLARPCRSPFFDLKRTLSFQKIVSGKYSFPADQQFDADAQDLITKILVVNPEERPSHEEVLRHPFLADAMNQHPVPELLMEVIGRVQSQEMEKSDDSRMDMISADDAAADVRTRFKGLSLRELYAWRNLLIPGEKMLHVIDVTKKKGLSQKQRALVVTDLPRIYFVGKEKDKLETKSQIDFGTVDRFEFRDKFQFQILTKSRVWDLKEVSDAGSAALAPRLALTIESAQSSVKQLVNELRESVLFVAETFVFTTLGYRKEADCNVRSFVGITTLPRVIYHPMGQPVSSKKHTKLFDLEDVTQQGFNGDYSFWFRTEKENLDFSYLACGTKKIIDHLKLSRTMLDLKKVAAKHLVLGETVVHAAPVMKKTYEDVAFSKRNLILTSKPRLFNLDTSSGTFTSQIAWTTEMSVRKKDDSNFVIIKTLPNKATLETQITDLSNMSGVWIECLSQITELARRTQEALAHSREEKERQSRRKVQQNAAAGSMLTMNIGGGARSYNLSEL